MLLVANQLKIKVLAVVVALALVMPMVMMPVGAAQAQENCPWAGIEYLDAEIKIIDGQPVFVYEIETSYEEIPFSLSELGYAYADGQKMPLQIQGNSILVPTEEGLVAVPIEEFCVVMIDGEIALLAEENPVFIVIGRIFILIASHAIREALKDNVSKSTIKRVLKDGKKMIQTKDGRRVAWYKGVAVIVEKDENEVVTVMKMNKKSLEYRLYTSRDWILRNWTW